MTYADDAVRLAAKAQELIDVFNGKKAVIDDSVAKAIAAVPEMRKTFYVHQVIGDDAADGTKAHPLKTIEKALSNTPAGGVCEVYLQADYTMAVNISVTDRYLSLRSDGGPWTLYHKYYTLPDGITTYLAGFSLVRGAEMDVNGVNINLPSPAGVAPAPYGFTASVIKSSSSGGSVRVGAKLTNVAVTAPADFYGSLVGAPSSAAILMCTGCTFPASFAGHYISAVSAGTNPTALNHVLTNLSSL